MNLCPHLTVSAHETGWSCRECGAAFVLKGNVNGRLTRAASDAHDRGDSALADALAKLAIEIEENE